jgi:hypothetical protein
MLHCTVYSLQRIDIKRELDILTVTYILALAVNAKMLHITVYSLQRIDIKRELYTLTVTYILALAVSAKMLHITVYSLFFKTTKSVFLSGYDHDDYVDAGVHIVNIWYPYALSMVLILQYNII